jgi:hypothetical protein
MPFGGIQSESVAMYLASKSFGIDAIWRDSSGRMTAMWSLFFIIKICQI